MDTRLLCTTTTSFPINVPVPPAPLLPESRTYSATQGQLIDVPGDLSGDAGALLGVANPQPDGAPFFAVIGPSGPTSARPTKPQRGVAFIDTTISAVVAHDGVNWRNVATGAIA